MSDLEIAQQSTRGSFVLFVGSLVNAVLSAAAIIVIARLLGPSEYGAYSLSILVPSILLNLLGFGAYSGITRYAAYHLSRNEPEIAKRMTMNGLLFLLVTGLALTSVCYFGAGFLAESVLHRPELEPLVRFSSLLMLALAVFQSMSAALLGWRAMGAISLSNVLQAGIRLVAGVALVLAGFAVLGAVAGYAVSVYSAGLLMFLLLYLRMRGIGGSWMSHFVSDIRTMLSYGFLVFVGLLAINISTQYVVLVLAAIAANRYVGYYQSAVNVVTAITLTYNAIGQTLFPAFAHLEGTKGDIARAFRYATKYMGFILTPIIFLLMGTAPQMIRVLLGASFGPAALYLFLLSFSYIPVLFGYAVLPSLFSGVGRARLSVFFSVVNAAVLFVLAPLLGIDAHLGVPGLIYATLAANVAGTLVGLLLASRYLNARMDLRAAFSILSASVVSFLLVYLLQYLAIDDVALLILQTLVFAFAYLTLAPVFHAIGLDDIRALDAALVGLGRGKAFVNLILRYEEFVLRLVGRL